MVSYGEKLMCLCSCRKQILENNNCYTNRSVRLQSQRPRNKLVASGEKFVFL